MTIDIKQKYINPKSNGKIPVAILSSTNFDAQSQLEEASLTFGRTGAESSLASCNAAPEDVNGDGLPDLVCEFYNQVAGFQPGDTQGILKGKTMSGTSIVGGTPSGFLRPMSP
jgi:hypothetical protein